MFTKYLNDKFDQRNFDVTVFILDEIDDKGVFVRVVLNDIVIHINQNTALLFFINLIKYIFKIFNKI